MGNKIRLARFILFNGKNNRWMVNQLSWSPLSAVPETHVCSCKQDYPFFAICQERKCKACRTAWLLEIKHWQNSGYRSLKKKWGKKSGWGARLWSRVVAPAHARCGFYCLLIIARLLLGRIYWSRQPAWLLSACEPLVRWGRRPLSLLGPAEAGSLHAAQRYQEQLDLPLGVKMDEAQLRLLLLDVQQEGTF